MLDRVVSYANINLGAKEPNLGKLNRIRIQRARPGSPGSICSVAH